MKIAVIRFSALGDIASTIPTLRALHYKPTIITTTVGYELLKDEFDHFLFLKNKKVLSVISLIHQIRKEKFDMVLDFQCNNRSQFICSLLNTKVFNNKNIDTLKSKDVFFDIATEAKIVNPRDVTFIPKKRNYIVLNCGSSPKWLSKRLPPSKWKEISDLLYDRYHLPFILTGDQNELEYVKSIAMHLCTPHEILAGKTSIQELKNILSDAYLTVTTDSGPAHISAAQKTPTIGIYGPTDWQRFAPFGPWSRAIYDHTFFKEGIPPSKSLIAVDHYFDNIDIRPALEELAPYLSSS